MPSWPSSLSFSSASGHFAIDSEHLIDTFNFSYFANRHCYSDLEFRSHSGNSCIDALVVSIQQVVINRFLFSLKCFFVQSLHEFSYYQLVKQNHKQNCAEDREPNQLSQKAIQLNQLQLGYGNGGDGQHKPAIDAVKGAGGK